jgi:hypothetical protein
MPRRNRVDPWGDLHSVEARGLLTGNRGCLVDGKGEIVRHHRGRLWITCVTSFRDWRHPLDAPGTWTPVFFLDDAVALAAGHRPCGLCRRAEHLAYGMGVARAEGLDRAPPASELDRRLQRERLQTGRGFNRAGDRLTWSADMADLPDGTVIVWEGAPALLQADRLMSFGFDGWRDPVRRPTSGLVTVLTPPTSVAALMGGFEPVIHKSAKRP